MMNDMHIRQLLDQPVADLARTIFAAVVHHNDFKSWSQRRYGPIRVLHDSPDICLFVKCRKNDRQRFHIGVKIEKLSKSRWPLQVKKCYKAETPKMKRFELAV